VSPVTDAEVIALVSALAIPNVAIIRVAPDCLVGVTTVASQAATWTAATVVHVRVNTNARAMAKNASLKRPLTAAPSPATAAKNAEAVISAWPKMLSTAGMVHPAQRARFA